MWTDPIVEEVRRARAQIWEECGGDMQKLLDRLKQRELEHPMRVVTPEEVQRRQRERADSVVAVPSDKSQP